MCPVTAKEDKGKGVIAVNIAAKSLYMLYITSKTQRFSFKSGCIVRMAKLVYTIPGYPDVSIRIPYSAKL